MEFPTIRYDDLNGKPYRFTYGCWMQTSSSAYYDGLVKLNVVTGEAQKWVGRSGMFPGEPIFVPRPEGDAEDDGVLLSNVLDTSKNQTFLLILDASSMQQVAWVGPTPHAIPHGYHGRYYDLADGH